MRRIYIFATIAAFILCYSCSKPESNQIPNEKNKHRIVGVWESEKFKLSFGSDGFYSAYIEDRFIDCGDYQEVEGGIICQNQYFGRVTTYKIKPISETEINAEISYTDIYGKKHQKSMSFTKSSERPSQKNNNINGKVYTYQDRHFGTVTMNFSTYNSGVKSASKGSAKKYPLNFFYIYIGDKIYHQVISGQATQVPSIGGWSTGYYNVICWKSTIEPDGRISDMEYVDLK